MRSLLFPRFLVVISWLQHDDSTAKQLAIWPWRGNAQGVLPKTTVRPVLPQGAYVNTFVSYLATSAVSNEDATANPASSTKASS
jgi:hypothetical protein